MHKLRKVPIQKTMRYPKLRELKEAIIAIFSKRYTTRFPKVAHKPPKGFRGKPEPDNDWCIGCEACHEVCPADAIVIEDDRPANKRIIRRFYDRCIFCGQCEIECPQEQPGVVMSAEYDLADFTTDSMQSVQEFELISCSKCGGAVGTKRQLLQTAKKMGPALASTNPELILAQQKELGFGQPPIRKREEFMRSDIFVFLCPACRHKVYTEEANR
jgi:formate hydrogenlyase subunit 6/NADH:ubiquinone oxidoreductase subunit I